MNMLDATSRGTAYRLVICDVRGANLRRITGEVLLVLPENGSHLKAELPRPFSYLLPGFKTRPESFFSCWVKSTFALSRVNPTKLIGVLAAVACRCFADRFGHQTLQGRQMSLAVVTPDVSVGGLHSVKSQNLETLFSEVNEPL